MDLKSIFQIAIDNKQKLDVIYHGGSQAGKARIISPLSIRGDKVRARCYSSNAVKTFILGRFQLVDAAIPTENYDHNHAQVPNFCSLEQVYEFVKDTLKSQSWELQFNNDSLTLHKTFKNGRLIKSHEIGLFFEEFSFDLMVMESGEIEQTNIKPRTRPWIISAKNYDTKTFGKLDNAVSVFLKLAKERSF